MKTQSTIQPAFDFALSMPTAAPRYRKNSDTSREAAEIIKPSKATLQAIVLKYLLNHFSATPDQIALDSNIDKGNIRPRFSELSKENLIVKSGRALSALGNGQNKYSLTAKGRQVVETL